MSRVLSFPGLGLEFEIAREAISVGPFTIYWYGIIVVLGIGGGLLYAAKRSREFGIHPERMSDLILISVVAGLIGARIYYVVFSWDYYSAHPEEIIRIWEGGIALYGGVIGAFLMGWLLCRRWKIPFLSASDCAVAGLILGQSIGRWGNFVNIEAFGSNTGLPWGMTGPTIVSYLEYHKEALAAIGVTVDPSMPVHPTFFYESMWNLAGFLFLAWYTSRRKFNGELTLLYCGWYGLGRSWIEGLRTDSLMLGSLRVSQVLAVAAVILSAVLLLWGRKKRQSEQPPDWLVLAGKEELAARAEAQVKSENDADRVDGDAAEHSFVEDTAGQTDAEAEQAPAEDAEPSAEEGAAKENDHNDKEEQQNGEDH